MIQTTSPQAPVPAASHPNLMRNVEESPQTEEYSTWEVFCPNANFEFWSDLGINYDVFYDTNPGMKN